MNRLLAFWYKLCRNAKDKKLGVEEKEKEIENKELYRILINTGFNI